MNDDEWVDIFCLSRMIARLDIIESLIPEQNGKDERYRQKLVKLCNEWSLDLGKRIDKLNEH